MRKIKIGIFGLGRGSSFYGNIQTNGGEIVAVCDMNEKKLAAAKETIGEDVALYTSFDEFICHEGMEAVFLCNYFHEHAPYAVRALEQNVHVLSECISNATMAEGVALVRAAEKSSAFFMIAENYPFMKFNLELKRVCDGGTIGKVLFAEGEYNHPLDPSNSKEIKRLRPYLEHWRNMIPRTYYITHSLAPLMHITGARPIRVCALPVYYPYENDSLLMAGSADRAAIITTLNDDDSVFRVTGCAAFGAHGNSYRICGDRGQVENLRGTGGKVMLRYNSWDIPEGHEKDNLYMPEWNDPDEELILKSGHGGGDFIVIREFFTAIRENRKPVFDEYFATTMSSVAILGYRSMIERGVPYDIPDLSLEEERVKYENDRLSPFYGSDGSKPTLRTSSRCECELTEEEIAIYEKMLSEAE